jgi:outer membrane scaffolding protein for murein synthesis (MipA/OmpV family)
LWEAGLGIAAIYFPHYRGSEQSRAYVLPAPYFVYRGDFFKADRNGVRGIFYRDDLVDLNMSVGASLPVDSEDTRAREGMTDLDPSIELGPSLDITLWRSANRRAKLDLRTPLRGAITISSHPKFIGFQFFPHLNLDFPDPAGYTGWNLGVLAGPVFTDSRYNRYFYEVARSSPPLRAPRTRRPGAASRHAIHRRALEALPKVWVGGFARYDTLQGARFEESPLVTSKHYFAAGIAVSWIFGESSQRVPK